MNELARWDPFRPVSAYNEGFLDLIPALLRPVRQAWSGGQRMDVAEVDGSYRLAVELPGARKEDIQVSVYENTVTINAELPEEKLPEDAGWLLRERSSGKLSRSVALPEAVDDEASEARYVDGVLYLTLRKKSASQTKRLTVH